MSDYDMDLNLTCLHCGTDAMEGYDIDGLFLCSIKCLQEFKGITDEQRRNPARTDDPDPHAPVFDHLPSASEIARWFRDEDFARRFQNVGGDATGLSHDPPCSLWLLAKVDHDEQVFYLLDIHTTLDGVTTSDLLFVTAGLVSALEHEWRMRPSQSQEWGYEGMVWFWERIEAFEELAAAPSTEEPTRCPTCGPMGFTRNYACPDPFHAGGETP